MHAMLIALLRNHFDLNDSLSAEQYDELQNLAFHETPPVMYYLEDGKQVELLEITPSAQVSIEELAEREFSCQA
jgi:hypothetical protein